jgi:hypothetical protein
MPKIRNIIIFVAIAGVLILVYVFFIKPSSSSNQANLVSSSGTTTSTATGSGTDTGTQNATSSIAGNFLTLLLSVKTIQLNTDIFSDPAFTSLHDSSIVLVPDATTGRPDPFAQFGAEDVATPTSSTRTGTNTTPIMPGTTNPASGTTNPAPY